ncbi:MAG TPA: hypothetical protein V6D43_17250 [Candidatus Sericytochromatia bacterium]
MRDIGSGANNPSIIGVALYRLFFVDSPTASFVYLTVANDLAQGGNGGIVALQNLLKPRQLVNTTLYLPIYYANYHRSTTRNSLNRDGRG